MTKRIRRLRGPAGSGTRRSRSAQIARTTSRLLRGWRAADRVGGAGLAMLDHARQRLGVVLHEQPVAAVGAVAVDRQLLALQRVQRDQRDQLLRELPWAVIVGVLLTMTGSP